MSKDTFVEIDLGPGQNTPENARSLVGSPAGPGIVIGVAIKKGKIQARIRTGGPMPAGWDEFLRKHQDPNYDPEEEEQKKQEQKKEKEAEAETKQEGPDDPNEWIPDKMKAKSGGQGGKKKGKGKKKNKGKGKGSSGADILWPTPEQEEEKRRQEREAQLKRQEKNDRERAKRQLKKEARLQEEAQKVTPEQIQERKEKIQKDRAARARNPMEAMMASMFSAEGTRATMEQMEREREAGLDPAAVNRAMLQAAQDMHDNELKLTGPGFHAMVRSEGLKGMRTCPHCHKEVTGFSKCEVMQGRYHQDFI